MTFKLAFFDRWMDPVADKILAAADDVELVPLAQDMPSEQVHRALAGVHGHQTLPKLETRPEWLAGRSLLDAMPNLLAVSSTGAGYDHIDVAACTARGILVVNNSGANAESVAQHAIGMILALMKNMVKLDQMCRREAGVDRFRHVGLELTGKTLGLIGLGRIGGRVAHIAGEVFGMKVIAYDPYIAPDAFAERGAVSAGFDDVFRDADVVSVHCPLTDETRGMIGEAAFAQMRPHAYFVSTARGGIHDETALAATLGAGRIAGAGLDVFEAEPPGPGHPLMAFDNVLVTPHVAGVTDVCCRGMAEAAAGQWRDIAAGGRPPRLINPEAWPRFRERYAETFGREAAA